MSPATRRHHDEPVSPDGAPGRAFSPVAPGPWSGWPGADAGRLRRRRTPAAGHSRRGNRWHGHRRGHRHGPGQHHCRWRALRRSRRHPGATDRPGHRRDLVGNGLPGRPVRADGTGFGRCTRAGVAGCADRGAGGTGGPDAEPPADAGAERGRQHRCGEGPRDDFLGRQQPVRHRARRLAAHLWKPQGRPRPGGARTHPGFAH